MPYLCTLKEREDDWLAPAHRVEESLGFSRQVHAPQHVHQVCTNVNIVSGLFVVEQGGELRQRAIHLLRVVHARSGGQAQVVRGVIEHVAEEKLN